MNVSETSDSVGSREPILGGDNRVASGEEVVVFASPEVVKLCAMVGAARGRLAELEASYTSEKARVKGEIMLWN